MNIFFLSEDPILSAQMQCDQHVVKMPLESAQMLCTAFPNGEAPYRWTHYNHPCNIWIRESSANYSWLIEHGLALCDEYTYRYDKEHKSEEIIYWCWSHMNEIDFQTDKLTAFPKAMPIEYKVDDPIESYRRFYLGDKAKFASWNKARPAPTWYSTQLDTVHL